MDRINETNIFSLSEKNAENELQDPEWEESCLEEEEKGEKENRGLREINGGANGDTEENKAQIQSNLQILLSQNDIVPLLKRVNKDKNRKGGNVSLANYLRNNDKKISQVAKEARNARQMNRNLDNENYLSDSEDDEEFVKLEEQPENLRNGHLKEYQMESLNWLIKLHYMGVNGILADEMGLGKTIQTISLIAYLQLQKQANLTKQMIHIVIVPKVTIGNWLREFKKWLPELNILYFYGNKDERKILVEKDLKRMDFDLILTTFESAMKERNALGRIHYEYMVIDEAHRLKNEKAKFSSVVRQFKTDHRLLLTGTPLQNNLHELWALLNFLMPNIFNDSAEFDKIFDLNTASEENQQKIVKQIHQILRPFVLRRLKSEVEFKLPPKKEVYLYVGLSELQKNMYKQILTKNIDVVNGVSKDKIQLLNILMQLKKVCNHPYLFPKVEKGPPFIEGEHLVYNSMKLKVMDVLLKKINSEGGKVLIFSQMTTLLNILDDYCRFRGFSYCRIDGSTSSEDRDKRIEEFQSPNSDKFIFLLSTRAGGLGINLHKANVVIIYDSDWNPQVDLQAIDRAHRIGQTRPVTIYRFVSEGTVEEKIVERAAKKLKIDHLIIQRGKPVQNKVTALEMTNMIQYGVDKLFNLTEESNEKDIQEILEYSINKTEKVNEHLKSIEEKLNINNLSLNTDSKDIYQFEGEDYKKKFNEESSNSQMFVNFTFSLGQRERKVINSNLEPKKQESKRPKTYTGWKARVGGGYLHQFFDNATLDYLDQKESLWKEYVKKSEEEQENNKDNEEIIDKSTFKLKNGSLPPEEFTQEDEEYREQLLSQGFSKWNKKDFTRFLRAAELYGLNDFENIARSMRTKTSQEVESYVAVFKDRIEDLPGGNRISAKINKFESEKNKIIEYQNLLDELFDELSSQYEEIYDNLIIPYKASKTKQNMELFNEDEDKYLICLMFKYGYRNWTYIKFHMLNDPRMKFNFNLKVKTDQELLDRANYLISCFKLDRKKKKPQSDKKKEMPNGKKSKNQKLSKKKKKKVKRRD